VKGTYFVLFRLNLILNLSEQAGKGRAAGAAKHLEFPAGGDQRVKFKFGLE
jgi:hypothetical protein